VQVLKLCARTGLVKLGQVVDGWLKAAADADAAEGHGGADQRGDEMPDWVAYKQARLAQIPQ
jgi:hypothetical protein